MAHCRAQPRETTSAALRVRPASFPKYSPSRRLTAGIRDPHPTTSRPPTSATVRPASPSAFSQGARTCCRRDWAISSKSARKISPWMSVSSIRHSMATLAFGFELNTLFALVSSVRTRSEARAFDRTSSRYFSWIKSAKWLKRRSSKLRPPTAESHAWESTRSWPFLRATTQHCSAVCPMSTNTTVRGSFSGSSVL